MHPKDVRIVRIRTADMWFEESLALMHKSFVEDELRNDDDLRILTDSNHIFSYNAVVNDGGSRVGLITTWNFGKCMYVEHFAIEPEMRGEGYGKAAIEKLTELSRLPIV